MNTHTVTCQRSDSHDCTQNVALRGDYCVCTHVGSVTAVTSLISSEALTVCFRSAGPNNMSEDQFGGEGQEMGAGCGGIIGGENGVVGNDPRLCSL